MVFISMHICCVLNPVFYFVLVKVDLFSTQPSIHLLKFGELYKLTETEDHYHSLSNISLVLDIIT